MSKNIREFSRKFLDLQLIRTPRHCPTLSLLSVSDLCRALATQGKFSIWSCIFKICKQSIGKANRCDSCECQLNDESLCLAEWSSDGSVRFKLADHSSVTLKFLNIRALFKLELILRREVPNFRVFFHSLVNLGAQKGRRTLLRNLNDKE